MKRSSHLLSSISSAHSECHDVFMDRQLGELASRVLRADCTLLGPMIDVFLGCKPYLVHSQCAIDFARDCVASALRQDEPDLSETVARFLRTLSTCNAHSDLLAKLFDGVFQLIP